MSVFLDSFWFYRGFGSFSAMGVQKHNKKRRALTKNSTKNPKPIFVDFV
jgi:hypothetical protein